jgi:hypothetical protein
MGYIYWTEHNGDVSPKDSKLFIAVKLLQQTTVNINTFSMKTLFPV